MNLRQPPRLLPLGAAAFLALRFFTKKPGVFVKLLDQRTFRSVVAAAALLLVLLFAPVAEASRIPGQLGVGLGSASIASGVSLKQYAGPTAMQLTAGCWGKCDGIGASLDFLIPMPAFANAEILALAWNFGAGPALGVSDGGLGLAGSFVLGLEVIFQRLPIDLVLEWRPTLHIAPNLDPKFVEFGGHIRFYVF